MTRNGSVRLAQRPADHAADAAVADQHDVIGKLRHRQRLARLLDRLGARRALALPAFEQPIDQREDQRIEEDRDDCAGEDEIAAALGKKCKRYA